MDIRGRARQDAGIAMLHPEQMNYANENQHVVDDYSST